MMRISTGKSRRRSLSGPGNSAAAAAGDAPSTMGPLACFAASASSACPRSISRHALRARSKNVCPCLVSSVPRAVRRTSTTPSSASSARRLFVAAGWETPSARAAPPTLPASASATNWRSWARLSDITGCYGQEAYAIWRRGGGAAQLAASLLEFGMPTAAISRLAAFALCAAFAAVRRSRRPRVIHRSRSGSSSREPPADRRTCSPAGSPSVSAPALGRDHRGGEPARRGWQRRDAGHGAQRARRLHAGRRGPGPLRAQPAHVRQPGLQRDRPTSRRSPRSSAAHCCSR